MLDVPSYRLAERNIFNLRDQEWKGHILENVSKMLQAAEQFGVRVKSISIDNRAKIDFSELKKTSFKILNIIMTFDGEEKDLELSYDIPWIIDNHFYIGGNYKVGIFQLFDKPLICRGSMIKLRTNIHSFMLEKSRITKKSPCSWTISMFNKKFPFANLIVAFFGIEETRRKFHLDSNNVYCGEERMSDDVDQLVKDISSILNDPMIDKTRLLAVNFPRRLDSEIVQDLKLITEVDICSKYFMETDNVVDELIHGIKRGTTDDCNYENKRLRFVEQVIYTHLCKDFYNMIVTLKKNKKGKFSNNSKVILSNVNTSSITQFDFSINPLAELALLSRTSLSGPGGFEKTNVPAYLRDLHPSMCGLIDPSDTADRDGCGTIQYLIPTVKIKEDGTFGEADSKVINSISVSHVPFLEHDDATRLQMSSSQQRHSIMLKEFDNALIQSGVEGMYTDHTSFIFKAERDGSIIYLDDDIIIIQYDNKVCKAFNIGYRKLYLSVADFYNVYYQVGETFNAGDIIAESNFLKNGRLTIGRNLLTSVMVWYGYNYEDGIVISDKLLKEDIFTSVHYLDLTFDLPPNKILENLNDDYKDYKPLPKVFDKLRRGDVFAKVRTVSSDGFSDVIFEPVVEHNVPEDCIITDIKIYANKWDHSFPQFDHHIRDMKINQKTRNTNMVDILQQYLTQDELEKFLNTLEINRTEKTKSSYKVKGDTVDGTRIEITAMYERKITVGDKLGNRHGNKGVISAIIPHDKMPRLPDGRHAEIIINPLGIVSRMNIGQLFELHLGMAVMDLKRAIKHKILKKQSQEEIYTYLMEFIKIIDKTEDRNYTAQMEELLKNTPLSVFIENLDDFFIIQPPYESVKIEDLNLALQYTGTPFEYKCFDPLQGKETENDIAFGYQYFMKLNHIAQDKIACRGVGPYSAKTAQPLAGKSRKGGQRLGEMEIWAVIGHGAEQNLNEFLTTKSDSIRFRNKFISEKMCNEERLLDSEDDPVSQSLRLLQNHLKTLGLHYQLNENMEE